MAPCLCSLWSHFLLSSALPGRQAARSGWGVAGQVGALGVVIAALKVKSRGTWPAQLVEQVTLDLGAVSSRPLFGVVIT